MKIRIVLLDNQSVGQVVNNFANGNVEIVLLDENGNIVFQTGKVVEELEGDY